jgi:hypothetical protein
MALVVGCGPSSATTGDASGTESGETGEPDDEILWTYGGGDRPVLSWPVTDKEGNIFVLVGADAEPDPDVTGDERHHLLRQHYRVAGIDLVSLRPDGTARWKVELATPEHAMPRELRWRPAVGRDGDVWVCHTEGTDPPSVQTKGDLSRVSSTGEKLWTAEGACFSDPLAWHHEEVVHRHALSLEGTYYLVALVPAFGVDGGDWVQELRAIGPDGQERWRKTIGVPSKGCCSFEGGGEWGTEVDAPIVLPEGQVVSGCDNCVEGMAGLASFDPSTGTPEFLFSTVGKQVLYSINLWDGANVQALLEGGGGLWKVGPAGSAMTVEDPVALATATELVFAPTTAKEGITFQWGEAAVSLTWEALGLDWVSGIVPSAVVEPDALLVTTTPAGQEFPCITQYEGCGLALVNRQGEVTWRREGVFGGTVVPAIGDGFIAYVEDDGQRLVAVKAPVTGVADGPWPIVGGNPQGTRSAEAK